MEDDHGRAAIKKFMEDRGLNAYDWAKRAGISEGTIRSFLTAGTRSMRHDSLERLARAESVTVAEMIGEKPRERPRADMVAVKGLRVSAAMGGGIDVSEEPDGEPFYFRRSWLQKAVGEQGALLRVIGVKGDSMEPTLADGDVALVHVYGGDPATQPGIYCFWDGHGLKVKRLEVMPGKRLKLRILSDNAALNPPYTVDAEDVRIVGRVIWRAGLL